jgi:predicted nucleotidyltransferase
MSIDLDRLASEMEHQFPDVLFAYLFGSAQSGTVRPGGDVDVAVWISDVARKMDLIPAVIGMVESYTHGIPCDLVFLNDAGELLAFEVLQGRILFIRKEARELHAGFYSLTCREYEDKIAWMEKQLKYRGYEVQWNH